MDARCSGSRGGTVSWSPDRQALARWTELSDPWAARTITLERIFGSPFRADVAVCKYEGALWSTARGQSRQGKEGPSRELSAADLLLIASTEAEAIDAMTVTTENYAVGDASMGRSAFSQSSIASGFWGFPATPFHLCCFVQSTCLNFRQTDLLVPNPSI